jgi:hypothetical protein
MEDSRAEEIVASGEQAYDTSPSGNNLPGELSSSILAISTEAESSAQSNNCDGISNEDGVIAISLDLALDLLGRSLSLLLLLAKLLLGLLELLLGLGLELLDFALQTLLLSIRGD